MFFVVAICHSHLQYCGGEGNLRPRRPPREYLGEYTS